MILYQLLGAVHAQVCANSQRAGFKSLEVMANTLEMSDAIQQIDESRVITPKNCSFKFGSQSFNYTYFFMNLKYNPQRQKGVASGLGVNVTNGQLFLDFQFDVKIDDKLYKAQGRTEVLDYWYLKSMIINQGDLQFFLLGSKNLTIQNLNVERIIPEDQHVRPVIELMLNKVDYCSIKTELYQQVDQQLALKLNQVLKNQIQIKFHVDYAWKVPFQPTKHILVNSLVKSFHMVSNLGFAFDSDMEVEGFKQSACGSVPAMPLPTTKYGGFQTIYSLMVPVSILKFALSNDFFGTQVNQHSYFSDFFQFAVGDFKKIVSGLDGFNNQEFANGSCLWNKTALSPDGVSVHKASPNMIQVLIPYNCKFMVRNSTIMQIDLVSSWLVRVVTTSDYLDFYSEQIHFISDYKDLGKYRVTNRALADFYLQNFFQDMKGRKLIGSGFPTDKRKRTDVQVTDQYIIISDRHQ